MSAHEHNALPEEIRLRAGDAVIQKSILQGIVDER
jgi:hypothetical protein